ncbi:Gfo/Idh/MocA family protein [Mangrovibacterium marinum]|uniref:UDP-N-acetyl-2-amino-2-deoxyglucuronate dehydrogenase n=1 Tax=Mangrovibacterium marinum TaxID=1639118 RepID=A0A2T5C6C2_9BACT|nr:Gfo/Idh/MocA family oxidoreductase [Mangrovibacterium marinum]PTN10497.1 UDP-N-acetyl-2-amino-2-deoxyglucuronate dehydrogenase [Mangrovibacterium marinum]
MKNFALIGAAGFVAERHLRAIKDTENRLLVATDPFDVVGRLDNYFPDSEFFTDFQQFEHYISSRPIDFTSICTPNYLHAMHIQTALHADTDVICEKPMVLNPGELEAIDKAQEQSGKKVFNILQLRLHPAIIALKEKIAHAPKDRLFDIELTYITSRGKWYFESWKGDDLKSGGVVCNIGIHFFDMLIWIFGDVQKSDVQLNQVDKASGILELKNARVRWFLSLDENDIPQKIRQKGQRTYRSLQLNGENFEFSDGFTDLHTLSYQQILAGKGFGPHEARPSILLTHEITNTPAFRFSEDHHPFLEKAH